MFQMDEMTVHLFQLHQVDALVVVELQNRVVLNRDAHLTSADVHQV
jgi:hypothetical protein